MQQSVRGLGAGIRMAMLYSHGSGGPGRWEERARAVERERKKP